MKIVMIHIMGLRRITEEQNISFYSTLTAEEKGRMHPWTKAKCVMMSGDSPVFGTRLSHNLPGGYDLPDEARPGLITPVLPLATMEKLNNDNHTDTEIIEDNAVSERDKLKPIATKEEPNPESQSKIEQNGINGNNKSIEREYAHYEDDDACIKCIYVAQQCCECVIT